MKTRTRMTFRPQVERVESRQLLSAMVPVHALAQHAPSHHRHLPKHTPFEGPGAPIPGAAFTGTLAGASGTLQNPVFISHLYRSNPPSIAAFSLVNSTGTNVYVNVAEYDSFGGLQQVQTGPPSAGINPPVYQLAGVLPTGSSILMFTDSATDTFKVNVTLSGNPSIGTNATLPTSQATKTPGSTFVYPFNPGWQNGTSPAISSPYAITLNSTVKPPTLAIVPA